MRTRIIVTSPVGSHKIANLYFSKNEPSFYIDFPYLILKEDKFLATKMNVSSERTGISYEKDNCFFFDKSPKISYHLSGQAHIKDSNGRKIPKLITQTAIRLDYDRPTKLFDIIVKNPTAFKPFNEKRNDGTQEDKNLFLDSGNIIPECLELSGNRILINRNSSWFNESPPNHPIIGGMVNPAGKHIPAIFFNFPPTSNTERVLFAISINFQKSFDCDEKTLVFVRSGFSETYGDRAKPYTQLVIIGPRNPSRMQYAN